MTQKRKKIHICNRCKKIIEKKVFYRYPHIWKTLGSNSVSDAIWSYMFEFCEDCCLIFDKNSDDMRAKYMYLDNDKLIKFYKQYI